MKLLIALLVVIVVAVSASQDWDHFVLAQSWPPGTCAEGKTKHHICHVGPDVKTWVIHGLWPSLGDTKKPYSCNSSFPFDFDKISKLAFELNATWPNLYNDTPTVSFWSHEWSKHGTCCQDLPATQGEYNYFAKAIELNRKYDLISMLSMESVTPNPDKQYSYTDFLNAVNKAVGFKPILQCAAMKLSNGTTYHLIEQIQICLNKDFTPRTCDVKYERYLMMTSPQSSCPKKYNFNYPPIEHV